MFFDYLQVFIPVICLLINLSMQVSIFRYIPKLGLLKSEYIGFVIGLMTFFLFERYLLFSQLGFTKDFFAIFATNFVTYFSLGYCYFHFITLGETARRIRILRELYDSPKGLSVDEILERYNAKEIVEKRIKRLLDNGQIIYKNGKYYIGNPTMVLMAKIIITMKLILLGKRSEFD